MAPPAFEILQMRLWGIVPVPAIIFIVLLIVFQIILSKTRFGRQVYAIGGNKNAAYLSGIKVDRIKIYAFMICAMLSSVAAMIHAAQISQGVPNEGQVSYVQKVISAILNADCRCDHKDNNQCNYTLHLLDHSFHFLFVIHLSTLLILLHSDEVFPV